MSLCTDCGYPKSTHAIKPCPGPPRTSTNTLTQNILIAINEAYQPHCLVFRLNVTVARTEFRTVRSAPNGTADLIGVIKGVPFAIEVKRGRDKQRPRQIDFEHQWEKSGGVYVIAKTKEQTMADIEAGVMLRANY